MNIAILTIGYYSKNKKKNQRKEEVTIVVISQYFQKISASYENVFITLNTFY